MGGAPPAFIARYLAEQARVNRQKQQKEPELMPWN